MMVASSRTRSSGPVHGRPLSPCRRLCSSVPYAAMGSFSSASAFASSTSSSSTVVRSATAFSFHSHQRPASPTRVHLAGISSSPSPPSTSFRLSISDRVTSPGRSLSVSSRDNQIVKKPVDPLAGSQRRTCMCSPTTHPGSFRCALHKNARYHPHSSGGSVTAPSSRLNMRRSAMTNSLVRIGTVEGSDLIKRALATLIRPSSHQQRRRADFQPRPSRLSVMSKADDGELMTVTAADLEAASFSTLRLRCTGGFRSRGRTAQDSVIAATTNHAGFDAVDIPNRIP